jgi:hypothetical protein
MKVVDHIKWLIERVAEQRAWIEKCGGTLDGYSDRDVAAGLHAVPGWPGCYYAPMFGNGGTAIYAADKSRLDTWELELEHWRSRVNPVDDKPSKAAVLKQLMNAAEYVANDMNFKAPEQAAEMVEIWKTRLLDAVEYARKNL